MATRWKNKCKIKYFLWTLLCIVPAMVILSAYPHIREQSEKESRKYYTTREFAEMLYNGNQVLHEEISGRIRGSWIHREILSGKSVHIFNMKC